MTKRTSIIAFVFAATSAVTAVVLTASPIPAQAVTLGPMPGPSERQFCGIPVVNHFIPACSNGRWEPRQLKTMRCIVGHAPYSGFLGIPKITYWAARCAESDWRQW